MSEALTLWGPVVAGAGFAAAVGGFGYFIDNKLDEGFRQRVRRKLMRVSLKDEGTDDENWPKLFLTMFDRMFDPKGTGRPSFWRSGLVSVLMVGALIVVWTVLSPERVETSLSAFLYGVESTSGYKMEGWRAFLFVVSSFFIWIIPINVVGDFFSLWESRVIIGRMADAKNTARIFVYLVLDFLATLTIFIVTFFIPTGVMILWFYLKDLAEIPIFQYLIGLLKEGFLKDGLLFFFRDTILDVIAIFFSTTLFTSVWVWLFILGGVVIPLFNFLRGVFAVEKFPIGSAMAIGGVFGGLVVTVAGYVRMAILS